VKVGKETILPPRLSCTLSEMVSKESRGEPAHKNKKRTKSPYNATKDPERVNPRGTNKNAAEKEIQPKTAESAHTVHRL